MMTAREDDLEQRMRYLESEMAGEKLVTRSVLGKAQRYTNEIAAVRVEITRMDAKVDRISGDIMLINAAQISQGTMLNILVQDVRLLRTEIGQVRSEMHSEIGQVRSEVGELRVEIGDLRSEMDARFSAMDARFSAMDAKFNAIDAKFNTMDAKFDVVLAAIRTIAPPAPPAA
jgi:hypothetical protein